MNKLSFAVLAFACSFTHSFADSAAARPNVVFFLADDQSLSDYSAYGNQKAPTPTTDAFAKEAMVFRRAFTGQAICAPSRSMLYTGLYPIRNGCFLNHTAIRPGVKTLPTYLRACGYEVILAGKSHVQPAGQFPWTQTFHPVDKPGMPRPSIPIDEIDDYLKTADQPFVMMVTSEYPHGPHIQETPFGPSDVSLGPFTEDSDMNRQKTARYYASIAEKEREFAKLLEMIDENDLKDNTVVFYASDHGVTRGKFTVYDSGLNIPLMVRWPGVIEPGHTDVLASFADFLPTALELAQGTTPAGLDGRSLVSVLQGKSKQHHEFVYGVAHNQGIQNRHVFPQRSIHDGRYHYIYNFNSLERLEKSQPEDKQIEYFLRRGAEKHRTQPLEEIYDTLNDPNELRNLAGQTDVSEIKARMKKQLFSWMESQKDYLAEDRPVTLLKSRRFLLDQPEAKLNYRVPSQYIGSLKGRRRDPHTITSQ